MERKGMNTAIEETRNDIIKAVNESLRQNVPVSAVKMIMELVLIDLNNLLTSTVEKEKEKFAEQEQIISEQIEWEETE